MSMTSILLGSCLLQTATPLGQLKLGETQGFAQIAHDALLTRGSQWSAGMMEVLVEQTGATPLSADFTLTWQGDQVSIDIRSFRHSSFDLEGNLNTSERARHRLIITPHEEWAYFPSLAEVTGGGVGRLRGVPKELDVRPNKMLASFPGVEHLKLATFLTKAASSDSVTGTWLDNGWLRIQNGSIVLFLDPASDADLVRLEHNMDARPDESRLSDPFMLTATYEWARDAHGVPYCQKHRVEHFKPEQPDQPVATREVTVTSYDSKLKKDSSRFRMESFRLPKGTRIRFHEAGKSRTWRHGVRGSEASGIQQADFEMLIEKAKQSGFAAPKGE